ncbi:hypothetical protein AWH62_10225 [Maricaulis sp. W15]|uniref:Uncharacterized protein n=1 Tax=Maricaulis maris TaxID=74318 RepID=A0A495D1F6_9PROT|nr:MULTISPECIES: hypothetical protein [Maricaulis]OLF72215.1 hypothetical protein AWH62_10225 [Maricaulis sp. W15]RKQ95326.1 hypothetical protein C7435_3018 [Maricaulis maris]
MDRHPHTSGNSIFRQNIALLALVSLALLLVDMVFGFLGVLGGAMLALVSMTSWLVLAGYWLNTLKPPSQTWIRFLMRGVVRILMMYLVLPMVLMLFVVTLVEFGRFLPG